MDDDEESNESNESDDCDESDESDESDDSNESDEADEHVEADEHDEDESESVWLHFSSTQLFFFLARLFLIFFIREVISSSQSSLAYVSISLFVGFLLNNLSKVFIVQVCTSVGVIFLSFSYWWEW